MKEALISMAMFGPGNRHVSGNPEIEALYSDFQKVLRSFLPSDLGFSHLNVRLPDVVMVTNTGDFLIDASSGGLMSLVDLAWQIFLYSQGKDEFVVVIDEPENHLHPSMQRSIVVNMKTAFPQAQFIVATHSPFIVSSVREAAVYVLQYNLPNPEEHDQRFQRSVSSILLDQVARAGTASEILREALGVPITIPIWAENELKNITMEFSIDKLDAAAVEKLKARLAKAGLADFYSDAMQQVVANK
jgi:hypothetical protein